MFRLDIDENMTINEEIQYCKERLAEAEQHLENTEKYYERFMKLFLNSHYEWKQIEDVPIHYESEHKILWEELRNDGYEEIIRGIEEDGNEMRYLADSFYWVKDGWESRVKGVKEQIAEAMARKEESIAAG